MATHGTFFWNELLTPDPAAAAAFLSDLVGGYEIREMPMEDGTYRVLMRDDRPVGGIMSLAGLPPGTPPHWQSYLAVDDVNATVRRTTELGGRMIREPFDVEGMGRIAVIKDPQGAVLSLITPVRREE